MYAPTIARGQHERINWKSSVPFLACHLVPLAAIWTGVNRRAVILALVLYAIRVFGITAGYHRYFAHRSYRLGRVPQFVMAVLGAAAVQKGPLWWAANHRDHHRHTDTARDPHTPGKGFWWSHVGWVLSPSEPNHQERITDFSRFPELRWLDKHDWVVPWSVAIGCFLLAGWSGLVIGFFGSTVLLWHATFSVNSVAHVFGRRRYATTDTSRNNVGVALLTFGEGWHNNHHHCPASSRQGHRWWEIDVSYYVLWGLERLGLVRDLRRPTAAALAARRLDARPVKV